MRHFIKASNIKQGEKRVFKWTNVNEGLIETNEIFIKLQMFDCAWTKNVSEWRKCEPDNGEV